MKMIRAAYIATYMFVVLVVAVLGLVVVLDNNTLIVSADEIQHDASAGGSSENSNNYIQQEVEEQEYDDQYDLEEEEEIGREGEEEGDFEDEEEPAPRMTEEERLVEYYNRGYQWPIPDDMLTPNTTGWHQLMHKRFEQVKHIEDTDNRYEAYVQSITTGFVVKNHTKHGFGIARCADEELMDELREAVRNGISTAELEGEDAVIPGPNPPLLVKDRTNLLQRIVEEMQSYAETWSQMELLPYGAYGFRVYRNESQLYMHIDRPETHVISFILHIDHSEDSQPWPLVIEDFHGNTHEVTLTSGDLLFYESCKLFHGRPIPFNGSWYSSVFVHYYPKYGWKERNIDYEIHYSVPPIWTQYIPRVDNDPIPQLDMIETALVEKECLYWWCGIQNSIKWGGPGEVGVLIAPTQQRSSFYPERFVPPVTAEEL